MLIAQRKQTITSVFSRFWNILAQKPRASPPIDPAAHSKHKMICILGHFYDTKPTTSFLVLSRRAETKNGLKNVNKGLPKTHSLHLLGHQILKLPHPMAEARST